MFKMRRNIFTFFFSLVGTSVLFAQSTDCIESENAKQRLNKKAESIVQKEREIFIGEVCSQCNRPASKIWSDEHVSFPQHLQSVHGIPIASTLTKYRATQQMQSDYDELTVLERIYKAYSDKCGSATIQRQDNDKERSFNKALKDQYVSMTAQPGDEKIVIPQANNNLDAIAEDPQLEIEPENRVSDEDVELASTPNFFSNVSTKWHNAKSIVNEWAKGQLAKQDLTEFATDAIRLSAPTDDVAGRIKTVKEFVGDRMIGEFKNINKCADVESPECDTINKQVESSSLMLGLTYIKNNGLYRKVTGVKTKTLQILEKFTR